MSRDDDTFTAMFVLVAIAGVLLYLLASSWMLEGRLNRELEKANSRIEALTDIVCAQDPVPRGCRVHTYSVVGDATPSCQCGHE